MGTFLILCVFHILGDFYFQWKDMADRKASSWLLFILHIAIYGITMYIAFRFFAPAPHAICALFIIIESHILIDLSKCFFEKYRITNLSIKKPFFMIKKLEDCDLKEKEQEKKLFKSFVIDQVLHLAIISVCYLLFIKTYQDNNTQSYLSYQWHGIWGYITIALIIFRPAQIFIAKALSTFPKPQKNNGTSESKETDATKSSAGAESSDDTDGSDDNIAKAGKYIGYLERIIVIVLVLLNASTAIGFVLTAKSIARYAQFSDQNFTERFLVGTLLSVVISLLAVILVPKVFPLV